MTQWQQGALFRAKPLTRLLHWIAIPWPVADGAYSLELGQFKITNSLGQEPPKVGERLTLIQGHPRRDPELTIQMERQSSSTHSDANKTERI